MQAEKQHLPGSGTLQLKMNIEPLQLRVELQSLLEVFGARTALAELATTEFGDELLVEDVPEAGTSLYYLPLRLTPKFIDHILPQLCPESRHAAIECLNKNRAAWNGADQDIAQMLETNADLRKTLQLIKQQDQMAHSLRRMIASLQKRSPNVTQTQSTPGEQ